MSTCPSKQYRPLSYFPSYYQISCLNRICQSVKSDTERMQINGEILDKPLVNSPFRMIISGSTGVGKTRFCKTFLTSSFVTRPSKIYYFYNDFYESSPELWKIKGVPFLSFPGIPSIDFFRDIEPKSVIIIDDQFRNCIRSKGQFEHFTIVVRLYKLVITSVMQLLSRHSEFSIILITQNLYEQGRECRNIR